MILFSLEQGRWQQYDVNVSGNHSGKPGREFYNALKAGQIQIDQPKWPDMKVGELLLRVE